ncbi:pentapeptide repeat-containing protein [Hamadaea tsunoensis]|uniref:pentapeptide repeat-containing protein n=1 Tax=Hamadaea tsunoensis TaxID=53368 RepID=UPI00041BAD74|nr:pentapeptide repeat-containing protein [Hamadaea tsunoensis]
MSNERESWPRAIFSGAIALATVAVAGLTFWSTLKQADRDNQAQATEHFNAGLQDLASGDAAIRLGGVLILTRIAEQDDRYAEDVLSFLEGLLRGRSQADPPGDMFKCRSWSEKGSADLTEAAASITKLSRSPGAKGHRLNLSGTCLMYVDLSGAHLAGADFSGSNLSGAVLVGTDLTDAAFSYAILQGAVLDQADLTRATLDHTNLKCAYAQTVTLTDTILDGVDGTRTQIPAGAAAAAKKVPQGFGATAPGIDPRVHPMGTPGGCVA